MKTKLNLEPCKGQSIYSVDSMKVQSGKLSIRPKRGKVDICPMECGFISCTNTNCGFHTNCDLEVEENFRCKVFLDDDNNYNIEFDDNVPGQMSIETLENGKYMPEHS